MEGEGESPVRRSSRPAFAEDVYGGKSGEEKPEMCESGLAQRRAASLTKLKDLRESGPREDASEKRKSDRKFAFRSDDNDSDNGMSLLTDRLRQEIDKSFSLFKATENAREDTDIEFTYDDADSYQNELAELYAYSEKAEFALNAQAYKRLAEEKQVFTPFSSLSRAQQKAFMVDVLARLENADPEIRLSASRTMLYLLQGAFLDFVDEEEEPKKDGTRGTGYHEVDCLIATVNMAYLAFEAGAYTALTSLLRTEVDVPFDVREEDPSGRESKASAYSNSRSASNMDLSENERRCRRSATLIDNESLRVVLSSLYHLVESIRRKELIERVVTTTERRAAMAQARQRFINELDEPLEQVGSPLLMFLLDMCPPFYNGDAPHYPMRKVLLLIWKILLTLLGGWDELREKKAAKREEAGLEEMEDTIQVAATLKASLVRDQDGPVAKARPRARLVMARQVACTGDEDSDDGLEGGEGGGRMGGGEDEGIEEDTPTPTWKDTMSSSTSSSSSRDGEKTPTAESPSPLSRKQQRREGEPTWKPKSKVEDIEVFLQNARQKFLSYELPGDTTTLFGLPAPIHASINTLNRHLYTSLADLQMRREEELEWLPFSQKETIEETRAEVLYRSMLPNLSSYIVALLKVLLAAAPSNKAKNDALNILCDVLTPETECSDVLSNSISLDHSTNTPLEESLTLTIDIYRHKEVMVKASSAILILLLKHLRLNHFYQFEFLAQHISLGNGVPLILKFLDQNMTKYIQSRHEVHAYNFPQVALYYVRNGEWPLLNADNVEAATVEGVPYSMWRNVFSSINLLRILNKITKWKHSRTMLLVVFKSAPILKRCLKIRQAIFQLYVLKLLKMQSRYLGRQWRRCNMDVISSIYSKIRHRLGDDWAFANETRTKSWHYQNLELNLKVAVDKFNARRYSKLYPAFALDSDGAVIEDTLGRLSELRAVDNSAQSLLGRKVELGEKFKKNYELWMEKEVIRSRINWDLVLENSRGLVE